MNNPHARTRPRIEPAYPAYPAEPECRDVPSPVQGFARLRRLQEDDSGMSTVEYAVGTIAAAAFGAVLYTVVTGDSVVGALTGLIARALNTGVG